MVPSRLILFCILMFVPLNTVSRKSAAYCLVAGLGEAVSHNL